MVRTQHHQPPGPEQRVQCAGERVRQRGLGAVPSLEPLDHAGLEFGLGRAVLELGQRRDDLLTTGLPCDGDERRLGRPLAQYDLDQLTPGVQEPGVIRLGEIVVVPRDPEHRHDGHPPLPLEAARQRDRRQGLVDGVERPGEEPGLLAGREDQDVARREPIARRPRKRGRNHVRRYAPRYQPRLGEHERCDRRCHYPGHHASPSPNTSA